MRLLLAAIFAACAVIANADDLQVGGDTHFDRDLRFVSGKEVDLTPVHLWLRSRGGQRPMKHWRQIRVYQVHSPVGGLDHCVVKTEEGLETELLIAHLPTEIKGLIDAVKAGQPAIANLRQQVDLAERRVKQDGAATPTGGGAIVKTKAVSRDRAAVNQDSERLKRWRESLAKEEAQQSALLKKAENSPVLAMFTGRTIESLQVWDCGAPNSRQR